MIIDPATNLPELPEGYLWYIGQHSVSIVTPAEDSEWSRFDLKLKHPFGTRELRSTTDTVTSSATREIPTSNFFGLRTFKTETYQKKQEVQVTEYRYVNRLQTVEKALTDIVDDSRPLSYLRRYKITEADILPLCTEALKSFNDKRQSEEELERLVGLYPPKKFEANS